MKHARLHTPGLLALACLLLAGCVSLPTPQERWRHADTLATAQGWQALPIAADPFELLAYAPRNATPADTLTLYLEGDGFAWLSASMPSADPTPRDPLALRLALLHPGGHAAYLARPCQFADAQKSGCAQRYWTHARFAPEVIDATNRAVDALKQRFGAKELVLVGYSGGGAVAALVAARRQDIRALVTVAGNLDHGAWTRFHRIDALRESLNAADVADRLARIPQTHFVGGKDRVIPLQLAQHWPPAIAGRQGSNLRIIPDADHACCWVERWPGLFQNLD